ncbi:hypothetical protein H4I96_04005 [Botrytis cinerea]
MISSTTNFRAPGTFGCEFCPQSLPTKGSLNRHRNTHIRPYKCIVCQSGFALRSDLRRHEGKHGSVNPRFMCKWPECDFKGSARKDNLLRHMKKMHSKVATADEEDNCNAASLQDAYDEAIQNLATARRGDVMETTDTGKTALHVAAFNGHLKIVKLLLNTIIEHNAKDTAGRSALHDAARGGYSQIFRELIAAGMSLYDRDNNDEDPMCEACRNGHRDLAQEILGIQMQLSLSDGSPMGSTSNERSGITKSTSDEYHDWVKTVGLEKYIKLAIENGHHAIAEIILFQHSDIKQNHLRYALEKAASNGEHQLVVSILQKKDQLGLWNYFRALRLAAMHRDIPIMDTLFEEAIQLKIGAGMGVIQIMLLDAVVSGNDNMVRFLIGKGANPNYRHSGKCITPLYKASSRGKLTIVTTLLEAGAYVDFLCSRGTALYIATKRGNKEVVALLLEAGANPNVSTKYGETVLQAAVKINDKATINLLIEKGTEINASGNVISGTALQEAVKGGDKAIIDLLIEKGAEINASGNRRSGTALQEAVKGGDKAIIDLLIEKGAEINASGNRRSGTALQEAVKGGDKATIDLLIEKGADINASGNHYSGTALQEAIKRGNESIIIQLIQLGADINAPINSESYSASNPGVAIQEAVKHGDQTIVDMLLLAGADVKVPANKCGGTPLQEAVRNGNEYMVKQLIDLEADVNAPAVKSWGWSWRANFHPETAIREAVKRGNRTIMDMLIRAGAVDPGED